jgi:hypothetical protein
VNRRVTKWVVRVFLALLALVLVVLAVAFHGWFSKSQPVVVDVDASSDAVAIGMPEVYTVIVRTPWLRYPLSAFELDLPENTSLVRSASPKLKGLGLGTFEFSYQVSMQGFEAGEYGPFSARGQFSTLRGEVGGYELTVELPKFRVVPSEVVAGQQLVGAPDLPLPVDESGSTWRRWAIFAVLVLLVLVIVLSLLLKKADSKEDEYEMALSAWDFALKNLEDIERALPMVPELFFVQVTDILKQYVEERFDLPASERTTPEFLREIRNEERFDEGQRANLTLVLEFADVVKFGRGDASEDAMRSVIGQAREFVQGTRPVFLDEDADDGSAPGAENKTRIVISSDRSVVHAGKKEGG